MTIVIGISMSAAAAFIWSHRRPPVATPLRVHVVHRGSHMDSINEMNRGARDG